MGWEPGPWMGPMWGFWWIFPVIGLLICIYFVVSVVRMMSGGGHFMCTGPRRHDDDDSARLRREIEDLKEQVKKLGAAR